MTGHDFGFAFHHVERVTVGFGHGRDQVDDEDRQQRQPVPRQEACTHACELAGGLARDDLGQVHRTRHHDHHQEAEAHGDFVRHHLCRCAQCTQEGVLGVGRPTGDDHAIHFDGRDGHDQQQTSVHIGQRHIGSEGNRHPCGQRRHDSHQRAQIEQALGGSRGLDQFLGQQLQAVGQRLQQTHGAHAVGTKANLHEAQQLALPQREIGHRAHQRGDDADDLDQNPEHWPDDGRPPLRADRVQSAVVDGVNHWAAPFSAARPSAVSCSDGARRTRLSSW
ncbi:hypothetical protein SDC9_140644 [bioreactor metagenome]|uniref:Uncharacterized protein n=1 Tax=bioreactor metagenome TaxID=1076179 RepID=A0A645DVZ5_9ZZZZ